MINLRSRLSGDAANKIEALDTSLAMIEFDPDGVILAANANFCKALGYEEREIVGQRHSLFVEPEYAASQAYRDFWAKLARGEFDAREYLRLGKGGREVWIQASYNPVKNAAGRVTKILKVATDITAQKQAEAERSAKLAAVERVQATIEFTTDGSSSTPTTTSSPSSATSCRRSRGGITACSSSPPWPPPPPMPTSGAS